MKTFDELTEQEQERARNKALENLLGNLVEGVRFSDELNHDTLQAAIDAACKKSQDMRTPWFASEYIMEATYTSEYAEGPQSVGDTLRGMAECTAEDALFPELDEYIMDGIIQRETVKQ